MCSLLPIGHLEVEWKTRILCSFFAAVGGIQISKSLHLNLNATRSQDWLWCLLDMWASKTSWIKAPTMGRLCFCNFFCSSDLKIFLLAKCSLTPPVGEHWRSLNNTRTAIALHWERFYPSHLKKGWLLPLKFIQRAPLKTSPSGKWGFTKFSVFILTNWLHIYQYLPFLEELQRILSYIKKWIVIGYQYVHNLS